MIRLLPLPLLLLAACVDDRKPASGDPGDDTATGDVDTGDTGETGGDTGADTDETDCDVVGYADADGDGFGAGEPLDCPQGAGFAYEDGDCDDADPSVFPGAAEVCDLKPNDCDRAVEWSPVEEAGMVTHWSAEGPVSHTEAWAAGTEDAPVALSIEGEWSVCGGTWYVSLTTTGETRITGWHPGWTHFSGAGGRIVEARGPIELVGLTLEDGASDEDGGLITLTDVDARLESVLLDGGTAARGGGLAGFWTSPGTLTLVDVEATGNRAREDGGAIYVEGPVDVVIEGGSFVGNAAMQGGAIHATAAGSLTLTGTFFEENLAPDGAGAVSWEGTGDVRVIDVIAGGNGVAEGDAGALRLAAPAITVEGGFYNANRSTGAGGALRLAWTTGATVSGVEFVDNEAFLGGAIAGFGAGGTITVRDATVSSGTAYSGAGAYFHESDVVIEGGVWSDNAAEEGAALTVEGCPSVSIGAGTRIEDNAASFRGGGLLVLGSTVTITGDPAAVDGFRRNESAFGGAICYELDADDTITAIDADFGEDEDDNSAEMDGQDLYTPGRPDRFGDVEDFVCRFDAPCE